MKNIVVLISGQGTNLQYIIDCVENNILKNCHISVVVSNRKNAYGLERAKKHGIPTLYVPFAKQEMERTDYDVVLAERVTTYKPDVVVLAGWMRILTESFIQRFDNIINLHPALPYCFSGMNAIERAYDASREFYKKEIGDVYYTGCMCHRVVEEVDTGQPLSVKNVRIDKDDTLEELRKKMAVAEKVVLLEGIISSLDIV